jgi:mannose-6-phosphate isomerase-like protein (cupin superfamily)
MTREADDRSRESRPELEAYLLGMEKINLAEKLSLFQDHFSPKIVGDLNDHQVKLVKLRGDFVWHKHDTEDEMFLVVAGRMTIRFRDGDVVLGPGEMIIVPKGVEHMPTAVEETHVVLIEPATTLNTGDAGGARTVANLERI